MKREVKIILLSILVLVGTHCSRDKAGLYHYSTPETANDGWVVAKAGDAGLNQGVLCDMMDHIINTEDHNIHNILIFKDNKLVFEEYFEGYLYSGDPPGSNGEYVQYDRETDHYLASVSKTVTSAIFGVAVKLGYITDIHEKVVDIFPEYLDILTGEKADIDIEHLLTMTTGLSWDETTYPYSDSRNDVAALFNTDDPLRHILNNTLLSTPGTEFLYNSGATNVLGAIIEEKTGMSLLDFSNEHFFEPLNVSGGLWQKMGGDLFFASGGVFLRPRELAKIGYVYLNEGYWGTQQLITSDWIDDSDTPHITTYGRTLPSATHYGYQWWLKDFSAGGIVYHCFLAAGWGDQYMFVFPDIDMIVVFNGGNYLSGGSINQFDLVEDYILAAVD